ncbi:MAG: 2-oxoglutarate dehydrogenase E1 component [Halobacteriovoraceae bacterium]|nr:2-oxoglutarate dehydrogenase E1 component [Halobacteriovoraceae bacterium]
MTPRNDYSHLLSSDNGYIDSMYEVYKENPSELDESWQAFFKGFEYKLDENISSSSGGTVTDVNLKKEFSVFRIIQAFRARGHLLSDTNPIRKRKDRDAKLDLSEYGLEQADLEREFSAGEYLGLGRAKLVDILDHMRRIYCYKIGLEYYHSNNTEVRRWVREKFEKEAHTIDLPVDKKKRTLHKLNQASVFENFLQTKYIGQKRFSLEGGESTIPALDAMINHGAELGVKEFVIGMAHRGRLNVLANILGKSYGFIFKEFEPGDDSDLHTGGGDVKYHQGFSSIQKSSTGKDVYLKLMHNPSHLEAVAPVALGYARAQSDLRYDKNTDSVVPVMIHGDAAVAAQGVVYETLQMAELKAYQCGGAIHFVINNQIGFTTNWEDARSSHYCTSLARTLEAPIIHVNGDNPESVVYAMELAVEFRQKFKTDIFIDMVCYRKHGHNEGDEPKYTQPELYGLIAKHKGPREIYSEYLIQSGAINKELAKEMEKEFKQMLSDRLKEVKEKKMEQKTKGPRTEWLDYRWSSPEDFENSPQTGVDKKQLDLIMDKITSSPEGFNVLKKAAKIIADRKKAYEEDRLDWAIAELLAYGSLLLEENNIRFTGQDVVRGTFSHRMSMLFDEKTAKPYCGLSELKEGQGELRIYNSHLSEYAVLGFEYGYSLASPMSLNIWEAQFGDFSNTAQVIIDQFISSGEFKWERMSGITMLLPHGYEGQGPEHSSCRPERYLQLCAQHNMVVCNPTTPANMFHLLRRQMSWEFRKPLIVFTPKSLLRAPDCVSPVEDLTKGEFLEVIDDQSADAKKIKRVLFCTGKMYYDLVRKKNEFKTDEVAIVRLEQIYPFPKVQFGAAVKKYANAEFIWVQEEPINMGYWEHLITRELNHFMNFKVIARPESASPATGYGHVHQKEQSNIINEAFKNYTK